MGIVCMCKRCAGTGHVFAGVKPFRFKRCPRCSGKGGKVARAVAACLFLSACAPDQSGALIYMLGDAVSSSATTGE